MEIKEFRIKVKPGDKLLIEEKEYSVKEVIRYRFDDGSYYYKCHLDNDYTFADDLDENIFILVKQIKVPFQQPFPANLSFDDRKFKFLYTAHAIAEEVQGEEIFKKGYSERFWDYKSDDESYLSLGISDSSKERLDFYGKIISIGDVRII